MQVRPTVYKGLRAKVARMSQEHEQQEHDEPYARDPTDTGLYELYIGMVMYEC